MNAHDVRYLVLCKRCTDLGDKRDMIKWDNVWWHGRCYVREFGEGLIPENSKK